MLYWKISFQSCCPELAAKEDTELALKFLCLFQYNCSENILRGWFMAMVLFWHESAFIFRTSGQRLRFPLLRNNGKSCSCSLESWKIEIESSMIWLQYIRDTSFMGRGSAESVDFGRTLQQIRRSDIFSNDPSSAGTLPAYWKGSWK